MAKDGHQTSEPMGSTNSGKRVVRNRRRPAGFTFYGDSGTRLYNAVEIEQDRFPPEADIVFSEGHAYDVFDAQGKLFIKVKDDAPFTNLGKYWAVTLFKRKGTVEYTRPKDDLQNKGASSKEQLKPVRRAPVSPLEQKLRDARTLVFDTLTLGPSMLKEAQTLVGKRLGMVYQVEESELPKAIDQLTIRDWIGVREGIYNALANAIYEDPEFSDVPTEASSSKEVTKEVTLKEAESINSESIIAEPKVVVVDEPLTPKITRTVSPNSRTPLNKQPTPRGSRKSVSHARPALSSPA